jgi:hypothetical protein
MSKLPQSRVVVRFNEDPISSGFAAPAAYLEARDPSTSEYMIAETGGVRFIPVFSAKSREKLPKLQALAARRDPSYKPVPLHHFYYVEAENGVDPYIIWKGLTASAAVHSAEIEMPGPDPAVDASNDPRAVNQGHLGAAPVGIDARYAWTFAGGDGAGQTVVDIERGWTLDHEDIAAHGATLLNGTNLDTSRAHGTAVLGELCGVDNAVGGVGIAPNVAKLFVASRTPSLADSIVDVLDSLDFGDVMLLETQDFILGASPPRLGPSETVTVTREAIRLATALGVIVVEAGGNGTDNGSAPATDLDTFTNASGERVLFRDPGNPDFQDSGAIIVSAATSTAPHRRLDFATHGRRIDCYGWGQNIVTAHSNPEGATSIYRTNFGGTSGASPMVAGAALCVQGIYEAANGERLSPRQMRQILSDPAFNTAPAPTETTAMGVMPNLRGIIDSVLGVVPDVYIRDNVGDDGDPHGGPISSSPDIIVRPVTVPDPQAAFGEGSGTESNDSLSFAVEGGQDHFVYVRCRNRGAVDAANVEAKMFWAPVSTLVTPDLWTPIGSGAVTIADVPAGDALTCSAALRWPAAEIPAPGHYCFVGILGTANDPAPDPANFLNFDNFRAFIRNNNNVTWRNFNVVATDADDPEARHVLPWIMPGAPDRRARPFELELIMRLPRKAQVLLDMPLSFLIRFGVHLKIAKIDLRKRRCLVHLPSNGRLRFGPGMMSSRSRFAMRFSVQLNSRDSKSIPRIVARQLYEREEVGRVTWRFDPHAAGRLKAARAASGYQAIILEGPS